MEEDLNFLKKGRQYKNKIEDDLKLNSPKPNPPILGLCSAQKKGLFFFYYFHLQNCLGKVLILRHRLPNTWVSQICILISEVLFRPRAHKVLYLFFLVNFQKTMIIDFLWLGYKTWWTVKLLFILLFLEIMENIYLH